MQRADLAAVAEIENESLSPWSISAIEQELQAQLGRQFIAESPDLGVVGWCACRKVWPEAELLKIAVKLNQREKGIGASLLRHLIEELRVQQFRDLFLEVRSKNQSALAFYKRHEFLQTGLRSQYYSDPVDDAMILKRDLEQA